VHIHDLYTLLVLKQELWSKVVTDRNGKVSDTKLITIPLSEPSIAGEVVKTQKLITVPDCYVSAVLLYTLSCMLFNVFSS
jgi:hypothetical protein